jgi:preprotein translocase subunit SecF
MEEKANKTWFDRNYKLLMFLPIVIFILAVLFLFSFYKSEGQLFFKDVTLMGGTTITLTGNFDFNQIETQLNSKIQGLSIRRLANFETAQVDSIIIETSKTPEQITPLIEEIIGQKLNSDNSSIEFSGSFLGDSFYRQLLLALLFSFILMSLVIFILFRSLIPSLAIIFAALSDIILPLAVLNYFEVRLSAAGIAAFLMLIGYSVDTDILLTIKAIKSREGSLNERIARAFRTGIFMTSTALFAVLPSFLFITNLPESFRQIFLILTLGLIADIFNTWLTNVGIIKWYCTKKGIL